jgi:hypothetical protein
VYAASDDDGDNRANIDNRTYPCINSARVPTSDSGTESSVDMDESSDCEPGSNEGDRSQYVLYW